MESILRFDRHLAQLGTPAVVLTAAAGLAVVAAVDYITGSDVSLSLFYLGPVALVAWRTERWSGLAASLGAAATWFLADRLGGHADSHPLISLWNMLVRFGFFAVVSLLLVTLSDAITRERALARIDPLTGLLNRRAFEEIAVRELERSARHGTPLTVGFLDLDGFKQINDRLGHAAGDAVLRAAADVICEQLRAVDVTARLGGDEFALLLPDTSLAAAQQAMGRVSAGLEAAGVACSVGALVFATPPASVEAALDAVDAVMYEVKGDPKRRVLVRVRDPIEDAAA